MTKTFEKPEDCMYELARQLSHQPMTFEGRKGAGRQLLCVNCRRWKYEDERCNLFLTKTGKDRITKETSSARDE